MKGALKNGECVGKGSNISCYRTFWWSVIFRAFASVRTLLCEIKVFWKEMKRVSAIIRI